MKTSASTSVKGLKVLIVDDNAIDRLLFSNLLMKWGVESDQATKGGEAIELIQKNRYDLVLMDIVMPGMDGFETTHIIRSKKEKYFKELPIIAITCDAETPEMNDSYMHGIISKLPLNPETLHTYLMKCGK